MNPGSDPATSLESWLARSYTRFLHSMQEHACKASPGGQAHGGSYINLSPFLPIELDACFLESVLDKHTLDLAGAMYRVMEIVFDAPARKLLAANVISQELGKPISVTGLDIGSMQARITDTLGQRTSVAALQDADLDALFAAAKNAKAENGATVPPVDLVRIVDARLHEQLMGLSVPGVVDVPLDAITRGAATLLAGCRDGLVRHHPIKDKLATFMCKAGAAIRGPVLEDIAAMATTFLPAGSAIIVLHSGEAMTTFRVVRSKRGDATITSMHLTGLDDLLPIKPDTIVPLSKKLRRDAGASVVIFISMPGIIEALAMAIDGIAAREHERNGPALLQSIFESIGLYARTFEQTWYSRPRAMVTKLFPRFLARFAKIRIDLPRLLHDKVAKSAISAMLDSFGKDFSLVACFPVRKGGEIILKAIEITVRNLVPVGFTSVDSSLLAGVTMKSTDASAMARALHDKLATVAPVPNSRFVLVTGTKVADAIASTWRIMFKRIAWNPFALFNVIKHCKDQKSLGCYPMPQAIGNILKQKHKEIIRQLSRAFVLRY